MRQQSANRNPVTCCKDGFTGYSRSQKVSAIRHLFSAHGVVVLSLMIRTALLLISGRLWKTTITERSPTSSLQSQIGRRRGNFLDLSVTFSLLMPMHEFIRGEKLTGALTRAESHVVRSHRICRSLDRCIRDKDGDNLFL